MCGGVKVQNNQDGTIKDFLVDRDKKTLKTSECCWIFIIKTRVTWKCCVARWCTVPYRFPPLFLNCHSSWRHGLHVVAPTEMCNYYRCQPEKNHSEMRSPLFIYPLFMQKDSLITCSRYFDCLSLRKDLWPICDARKYYLFPGDNILNSKYLWRDNRVMNFLN